MRIYFDKEARLYPEFEIDNQKLQISGASLENYLSSESLSSSIEERLKLISDSIKTQSLEYQHLVFIIHGYRKPFIDRDHPRDSYSWEDAADLRRRFQEEENLENCFFVELYWDCYYDCCLGFNKKDNQDILQLYESMSIESANKTALSLQRILLNIQHPNTVVFSHSAGARIALLSSFIEDSDPSLNTLKLVFVAPALPITINEEINGLDGIAEEQELIVLFNRKDFVLRKKDPLLRLIGPGYKKYGNTGFGCNKENSIEEFSKYLEHNNPEMKFTPIDFKKQGMCHLLRCYCFYEDFEFVLETCFSSPTSLK